MIRRPPRSTRVRSSAASDVYKRKGNNSKDNIEKVTSKMSFVGAAKANQAEELLDVPLSKYEYLYKNMKSHEIFGYRTKHQFYGSEFTTVVTYNEGTYKLQKSTYETTVLHQLDQKIIYPHYDF